MSGKSDLVAAHIDGQYLILTSRRGNATCIRHLDPDERRAALELAKHRMSRLSEVAS